MSFLITFGLLATAVSTVMSFDPFLQEPIKDAYIQLPQCDVIPAAQGCEEARIHEASGTAIFACSNIASRYQWFPPLAFFKPEIMPYDYFAIYDIKTGKSARMNTPGFNSQLRTHGLGIWSDPTKDSEFYIYAVNHKTEGSVIEIFKHEVGTNDLIHQETAQDDLIKFPNSVAGLGPRTFFTNNDHSHKKGILRLVEDTLALAHSNVIRWDAGKAEIVASKIPYANGIDMSRDGKTMYMASSTLPGIFVYSVTENYGLNLNYTIKTKMSPDNIHIDENGDILITGLLNLIKFTKRTKNADVDSPSATLRLRRNEQGDWEELYIMSDDGSSLSTGTCGNPSRKHDLILFSGFLNEKSYVCKSALSRIDKIERRK